MNNMSNIDNDLEFLAICRTCLDTKANSPIIPDKTNATYYTELVFIATGIKVQVDDGLPQNMCQNCLDSMNKSLDFRKQCKNVEATLSIMKSKFENKKNQNKTETNGMDLGSQMEITNKLEIASSAEIIHMKNNDNKLENLCNDKTDSMKVLIQEADSITLNSYNQMKTVVCKLCKKTVAMRKYKAHTKKHMPTVDRTVRNVYFTKNQFNKHLNSTHQLNKHEKIVDTNVTKNPKYVNDIFNCKLVNSEMDNTHNVINDIKSDKYTANDNSNTEFENMNNIKQNELVNYSNDNHCKEQKIIDTLTKKTLTAKVKNAYDNNELKSEPEHGPNKDALTNKILPTVGKNICNDNEVNVKSEIGSIDNILYYFNGSDSKRVTCKLCQKNLSIRSVDSHILRHHPGADKRRVKCELCDNYVLETKLNRHVTLMHGDGFMCRYCQHNFQSKETLVEHVIICDSKKIRRTCVSSRALLQCGVCHKTMQKGSLRLHTRTAHAGLRPVCEHCGKSFGNKLRLADHYRAKHGYEKFKCAHCDFRSACAVTIKNHERRHRDERPFVCEACGAAFHAASLLAQHRRAHARDRDGET